MNDFGVFFERASHLFPRHEFCYLFGQLPEFLEINVAIR